MRTINSKSTNLVLANTKGGLSVTEVTPALQRIDQPSLHPRFDRRVSRCQRFPVEDQLAKLPQKTHVGNFLDIRV
ncbi:MAG: hypothetical protein ACE1ZA_22645 [Pseudomonadales bacterium]